MFAFPAFKISLLFVKQLSKHIANRVKSQAKNHPAFKDRIISFAQSYHRLEIRMKRRQAEVSKPNSEITPLDDSRAIELAANFIGESIIFSVAAMAVVLEAYRKRFDDQNKAEIHAQIQKEQQLRIINLEEQLNELRIAFQSQQVESLTSKTKSNMNSTAGNNDKNSK